MASKSDQDLPSWESMFRALKNPKLSAEGEGSFDPAASSSGRSRVSASVASSNWQLAMYIALAHAGLLCTGAMLVGLFILLKDFWETIFWAILCSIPLRKVQDSLVTFWEPPLKAGLVSTLLSPLRAVLDAVAGTLYDIRVLLLSLVGMKFVRRSQSGFGRLSQWLITFAVLNVARSTLGLAESLLAAPLFTALYRQLRGEPSASVPPLDSDIQKRAEGGGRETPTLGKSKKEGKGIIGLLFAPYRALEHRICSSLLGSLRTVLALSIILGLVFGSLVTVLFFIYQMAMEGKHAVVELDHHMRSSNYLERIGVNEWLRQNNVSGMIDTYSATALQTISEQIDVYAAKYEMVDTGEAAKSYLKSLSRVGKHGNSSAHGQEFASLMQTPHFSPLYAVAMKVKDKALKYDFNGALLELQEGAFATLDTYNISREGAKLQFSALCNATAKYAQAAFTSGSSLMSQTASFSGSVLLTISNRAKETIKFLTSAALFVSLLYYLITSEAGGVMQQLLDLLPFSERVKHRCETVISGAISGVLLGVVEIAVFESFFTFLLLWFYDIHFLYLSTTIAFLSATFPVLPPWLSLIPGAAELAIEGKYVQALSMVLVHQISLSYSTEEIMKEIPGHNPYLIGLGIAGGTALFNSVTMGAIFGPLVVTVLIALRNLYAEFLSSIVVD